MASFCDHVSLVTFLGANDSQELFIKENLNSKINSFFLYKKDSPTITKRRFVDNYFFTKLLEVYEINDAELNSTNNEQLCTVLREQIPEHEIVIVVDFGHGMLSRPREERWQGE